MKTFQHILLIIIVCFITLITNSQAGSDYKAMPSGEATLESSNIFRIEVRRETWVDEAVFAFYSQALDTYENYDSWKMFAVDDDYPQTYTLTTDNVIVAINGETTLFLNEEKIIPLGFRTYVADTFAFVATNMAGFDPNISVYLEDLQQNVLQDLRINNIYEFTSGVASNATRFRLHYTKTANAVFTAGAILTTGQAICYNGDPSAIFNLTVASGGNGPFTYQWQSSTDVGFTSAVNISSNTATYNPPAGLAVNTWYRRQAKEGTGNTSFISSTGVWAVTVNSLPAINLAVSGTASICSGTGTNITVALSEIGTYYQLRNDVGDVNVGTAVAGNGGTINLPTGDLTSTTTFNVYATKEAGSAELTETEVVTIYPILPVSVSIAASPGTTVCPGISVTFTATVMNGGTAPIYQWKNNGTTISGATNSAYTSPALANGNLITCDLTSNAACATGLPITSNTLTITVAYLNASVIIAASPGTTVNTGTSLTFTATPTNGGTAPIYQWKINGSIISGATNSTYTCVALSNYNGKKITCEMTSNETCISGSPATSNTLKITVRHSPKNQIIQEAGDDLVSDDASFNTRLLDGYSGDDISIYPNPASSIITLNYPGYLDSGNYDLKIYSIDGKLISFTNLNNKTTMIDVNSYDAGVYYISIQSENGVLIRKFIKE